MKAKYIIGTIGVLGYLAYIKLVKYLKQNNVETFNYLRAESGNTFFLGIDIFEAPNLKTPILKWSIDTIKLMVDNQTIATSLGKPPTKGNFTQEFTQKPTANFESIKDSLQNSIVEITYKTIAGIKIKHQYAIKNFNTTANPIETENNNNNQAITNKPTTANDNNQQQAQTCTCEPINTPIK